MSNKNEICTFLVIRDRRLSNAQNLMPYDNLVMALLVMPIMRKVRLTNFNCFCSLDNQSRSLALALGLYTTS